MKRLLAAFCCIFTVCIVVVSSIVPAFAEQFYRVPFGDTFEVWDDYAIGEDDRWLSFDYPLNSANYHTAQINQVPDLDGVYRVRVPFSRSVTFTAGNYYTLHYEVQFAFVQSQLDPNLDYTLDISIEGVAPLEAKGVFSSNQYVTISQDVSFYCYSTFTSDYLYISIDNWDAYETDDPFMSLWSFRYTALSSEEHQNEVITGAITNQTTQIQNQIDQSTQDILQGSGLTGPVMPDVEAEKDAIDDIGSKEDEIEDLLGGYDNVTEDLENVMGSELDSDIVDALQGIQGVFTRLVETLQLSSLITFLLVLGLGLYIIGRRTS